MLYSRKLVGPFFVRVDTVAHLYAICDTGIAETGRRDQDGNGRSELET
jgi:hypothetical protein